MRLVPKFLSRRRKKDKERDADEVVVEDNDDDAISEEERIEVKTERVRGAGEPIELKGDVPEEEDIVEDAAPEDVGEKEPEQIAAKAGPAASRPMTPAREALIQEAMANRAKAKKVFDELSPETRERIFNAVLGPDWKSHYEDDA